MTVPLIERFNGDFRKVCEHYADQIKSELGEKRQEFIDWMMLTEKYSKSQWKKGMFGDCFLYLHCFSIYRKIKGDSNQHHMVLVSGKIGKGKSTLGSQIAALVDPTFEMSRICYIPPHLFKRIGTSKLGEANLVDEGGNFFKARNAMSKLGKDISQAFQLVRDLKQIFIICYDEPEKLDKDLIDKIDSLFVKIYNPSASGKDKFNGYFAFNVMSLDKIKPFLKKKLPVTHKEIMSRVSWRGRNSEEMPEINDITETKYRLEKRKYLKDHMLNLADKWAKEYEDVETENVEVKKQESTEWLPMNKAAERLNLHRNTVCKWVKENKLEWKLIGTKKYVRVTI